MTGFLAEQQNLATRSESESPLIAQALVQQGIGRSYGTQFLLRQQQVGRFFGWISYSILRSERKDAPDLDWRLFDYDQSHVFTARRLVRPRARVRERRSASASPPAIRARPSSARTTTRSPTRTSPSSARTTRSASRPSSRSTSRLAKRFKLGAKTELEVYLDVQNVTNHSNPEEIVYNPTYTQRGYITGFPILPVVGREVLVVTHAARAGSPCWASLRARSSWARSSRASRTWTRRCPRHRAARARRAGDAAGGAPRRERDVHGARRRRRRPRRERRPIDVGLLRRAQSARRTSGPVEPGVPRPRRAEPGPLRSATVAGAAGVLRPRAARSGPRCRRGDGNQTPGRPVDPDRDRRLLPAGEPVHPDVVGHVDALRDAHLVRSRGGASDSANDYSRRYHLNVNPAVASLTAANGGRRSRWTGGAAEHGRGRASDVTSRWRGPRARYRRCGDGVCGADESVTSCAADCTTPAGLQRRGALRRASTSRARRSSTRAKGLHVSWFATAGSFGLDRTGSDGSDTATTSDDGWQAPAAAGHGASVGRAARRPRRHRLGRVRIRRQ